MDARLYTASGGTGLRRERAYEELKRWLLIGDFPLNGRLAEERLAAQLAVSRTPIREALVRLHAEGLVERGPDGGWFPAVPDVAAIHDLYEVRLALELQGLRRPVELGPGVTHDVAVLEPLRDEWKALAADQPPSDPGFVTLDEDFHVRLARSSGNPALAELLQLVNERIRIVRMHDFLTDVRMRRTIRQHLEILDAVLAGDLPSAAARFGRHLGESIAVVEERVTRALARMATRKGAMHA